MKNIKLLVVSVLMFGVAGLLYEENVDITANNTANDIANDIANNTHHDARFEIECTFEGNNLRCTVPQNLYVVCVGVDGNPMDFYYGEPIWTAELLNDPDRWSCVIK